MLGLDRRRMDSMKGYARKLGMDFHAEDEYGLIRLLKDFRLFQKGHSRKISNILKSTTLEISTHIFDYSYVVGRGKDRKYRKQTVMFMNSKALGLPPFSMQPESLWHKLTDWLKLSADIDFDTHPEFSEQYFLKSEDEDLIRYIYDENVLDFFTINKNWHVEGINYFLILYSLNERFHPKLVESFYQTGIKLFELIRSHPDALNLDHPL